jgi:hypothetical protein
MGVSISIDCGRRRPTVVDTTQASAASSTEPIAAPAAPTAAPAAPTAAPAASPAAPAAAPIPPAYARAARPGKARRLWQYAISSVVRQLRRRRQWSNYGKYLQRGTQKSLWAGLERIRGRIQRTKNLQSPRQ